MNSLLTSFLIPLGLGSVLAYPIYRLLLQLKVRQTVSVHVAEHAHKQGTPTMGGLIILAALLPAMLFARMPVGLIVLATTYALIGFVDDFLVPRLMPGKRGLGWLQKLALQVGFAGLSVYLLSPAGWVPAAIAVFAILFFSNSYNFTDGMDWLSSTVLVGLALGGLVLSSSSFAHAPVSRDLFAMMIGAVLPFMVLNRPPAKIFMGDVGSMAIGGLLGITLTGLALPKAAPVLGAVSGASLGHRPVLFLLGLAVLSFVQIAELVPVPIQILSVKLRKKRVFPATPIHHAFQKAGWKETRVVALFFGVQMVCTVIAILLARGSR